MLIAARSLQWQQATGNSIRYAFERTSADISVRPDMARDISERVAPDIWMRAWQRLIASRPRPILASATLFGLLLLVSGFLLHRWIGHSRVQSNDHAAFDEYVIDVPIQTQTHVFERKDGEVVDAVSARASVAYARFASKGER